MVTWFDGTKGGMPPATAPGAVAPDGSPVLMPDWDSNPAYYTPSRYPPPATAELVTLWKKDRRVVMSVTANGKTNDFYMPPARLVYLLREVAEQLAENTLIQ